MTDNREPRNEINTCQNVASAAREAQVAYQSRGNHAGAERMGETVNRALDRINELKSN